MFIHCNILTYWISLLFIQNVVQMYKEIWKYQVYYKYIQFIIEN